MTGDKATLAKANSLAATAISAAIIAGPALSGVITSALPNQDVFVLLFVAPIPAFALMWGLRGVDGGGRRAKAVGEADGWQGEVTARRGQALRELGEGFRFTFANHQLRRVLVISFLGFFAYGAFDSLESLFCRDVLHASVDWMGWLNAVMGQERERRPAA